MQAVCTEAPQEKQANLTRYQVKQRLGEEDDTTRPVGSPSPVEARVEAVVQDTTAGQDADDSDGMELQPTSDVRSPPQQCTCPASTFTHSELTIPGLQEEDDRVLLATAKFKEAKKKLGKLQVRLSEAKSAAARKNTEAKVTEAQVCYMCIALACMVACHVSPSLWQLSSEHGPGDHSHLCMQAALKRAHRALVEVTTSLDS